MDCLPSRMQPVICSSGHLVLFRCVFKRSGDFIQVSERVREVLTSRLILTFLHSDMQQETNRRGCGTLAALSAKGSPSRVSDHPSAKQEDAVLKVSQVG